MDRLNRKVALVTGAGHGIGRATAKLLAAEGAKVTVVSRTPANVEAVVADIRSGGGTALGVICDIGNAERIKAAVEEVVAMQACHLHLKASGEGRVINFGSMAGVMGLMGCGPYNMAKEAVRALNRTAAREWAADKITVNNILPLAETWGKEANVPAPTNALARFGSPEEDIAPVVLFLASRDTQFLTGYSLMSDGGSIIDSVR